MLVPLGTTYETDPPGICLGANRNHSVATTTTASELAMSFLGRFMTDPSPLRIGGGAVPRAARPLPLRTCYLTAITESDWAAETLSPLSEQLQRFVSPSTSSQVA